MRQWEIELAETLSKIDDPIFRKLKKISIEVYNKNIQNVDISNYTDEDFAKLVDLCYLAITINQQGL